jgi:hypothetical protein
MSISTTVVNKLMLARYLFWMAGDSLNLHKEIALFAAVNLLQDSVEAFLLAASEHVNAGIAPRTTFEEYFSKIDQQIHPNRLPFRLRLFALNKARVLSKHNGVRPHREELEDFSIVCREFFEEACLTLFGMQFWSLSQIDLLEEGEVKELLKSAERAYNNGDWAGCMIDCRKVLFVKFESKYDVSEFREPEKAKGIFGPFSNAPYYAKNPKYIEESVKTPFDYIVLDHANVQSDLVSEGIDPQIFWNIWRLTPEVYRYPSPYGSPPNEWYIKGDIQKQINTSEDNASYILDQTINVSIHLEQRGRRERLSGHRSASVILRKECVNIYTKADKDSPIAFETPPGLRQLEASYRTIGLNGIDHYWSVWRFNKTAEGGPFILFGYIHADDVETTSEEFAGIALRGDGEPIAHDGEGAASR